MAVTRIGKRGGRARPPSLRRVNAMRRVVLTRAGRRRARALLFEPDGADVYYFASFDPRTEQARHHLFTGSDQRVFERAADMPEFVSA